MIERTLDYRRVRKLADWDIIPSCEVFYFIDVKDGRDVGVSVFVPHKGGFEIHVNMGENHRGASVARAARDAFAWIFDNTDGGFILAEIPIVLRQACLMARHLGMTFIGADDELRCFIVTKEDFSELQGAA